MIENANNEYDFDSSDEEDIRNTVGNIPLKWYESMAHIGYDTSGRPIMRPNFLGGSGDSIEEFLSQVNTEEGETNLEWRTVRDPQTGQLVILSDADLELVTKIAAGKGITVEGGSKPYEPWNEWFSKDVMQTPITAHPPQKRSFIPSILDRRRVGRMVYAIKLGRIIPKLPTWALSDPNDPDAVRRFGAYMTSGNLAALDSDDEEETLGFPSAFASSYTFPDVWEDQNRDDEKVDDKPAWMTMFPMLQSDYRPPRPRPFQKAAQEPLPGHIQSYNPPPEFLLTPEEHKRVLKAWRERVHDGHVSRIPPQMPQQFSCLRHVPFSERYLREREERVKDLMMATRVEKQRLATTPEAMLPQIPSLSELRPYPSRAGLLYRGHTGRVTGLSVSPCGQWLASISPSDGCLRIWETSTNYCFREYNLAVPIKSQQKQLLVNPKKKKTNAALKNETSAELTEDNKEIDEEPNDSDEEWAVERPTSLVKWNPKPELHLLAAAIGSHIFLINPAVGDRVRVEQTNSGLLQWWSERRTCKGGAEEVSDVENEQDETSAKRSRLDNSLDHSASTDMSAARWTLTKSRDGSHKATSKTIERTRITIELDQPVCDLNWHPKGDYLLSLSRSILSGELRSRSNRRLLLHRLSTMFSQSPFSNSGGKATEWRHAAFHPMGKPQLFVASTRSIRVFDLAKQQELRCLRLDNDFVSSIALHPSGDHLAVGSYDSRFNWFDIDLGNVAYKKLRLNHGAIRQLDIHSRRPLVSAALDDGTVLIVHASVSDDLLSKPTIIPVQLIRTGQPGNLSSVFATVFHPRQPHVYSGGADGSVRQFVAWQ